MSLAVAIAGAGRGIGAACARAWAARGARLFLCARTAGEVEPLARELSATALVADLSTDQGADAFGRGAQAALGQIDLGLLCPGAAHPPLLLQDATRAALLAQLEGNAIASGLAAAALLRHGPPAQLLFLSSLATRRAPTPGAAPYTVAKAALEAMMRAFAEEAFPRTRVNALCLGPVRTRLHEIARTPPEWIARFPSPEEIAPLVLLLAEARGLTGRCVDADLFVQDPQAAISGDGRLALIEPQPHQPQAEAEPGRRPSPRVRRALRETAATLHSYPEGAALLYVRLGELHGVLPEQIALSGGGASELLERALRIACVPGDEVLSPFPSFELLSQLCAREGLRHRPVLARRTAEGLFRPHQAEPLLAALGPRTRLVYLASPDNPTGAQIAPDEEAALREGLPDSTLLVLDEAWTMDLAPAPTRPQTVRLRSFSKLHGLAALRIGYAVGDTRTISLLRRLELPFPLGAPQIAAALAVLAEPERTRRSALLLARERARLATRLREEGLFVSQGDAPVLLIRDPNATAGRLLFALQAARLPLQQAHWDPQSLVLGVGGRAQNDRALAAIGRALSNRALSK